MNNVTRRATDLTVPGTRRRGQPQQDMAPTDQGRHDGRGCYPGCGPRPEGVEKKDKGKAINVSKVSIDTMITNHMRDKTDFD